MKDRVNITNIAITPTPDIFETQIILQRHCNYDKITGVLLESSALQQQDIVLKFLNDLEGQDLDHIYFLFVASNTVNANSENKRCLDTTNIAMHLVQSFFKSKGLSTDHIINMDQTLNYGMQVKQTNHFAEPSMFTDKKGYFEFLREKNQGINSQFWIDFEEDIYKVEREKLNAEGPDEIVSRGVHYINVLQEFSNYFHIKKPNSKLIVWCGTHYDFISPFAKQTIFGYEKNDVVSVDYCGGISLGIDNSNHIITNVNNQFYPICFEDIKPHHRHLGK